MTRVEMRKRIFAHQKRDSKIVTLKGVKMEIRQPTLGDILDAQEKESKDAILDLIISYCYKPGTEERVFEDGDQEGLKQLVLTPEIAAINEAIADMTNVSVADQEKN